MRGEEADTRDLLIRELMAARSETAAVAARPLRMIVELAAKAHRRNEGEAATVKFLKKKVRKAAADSARKRKALEAAKSESKMMAGANGLPQ